MRVLHINHEEYDLTEVGYFDILPETDGIDFCGTWSNYPYFLSGKLTKLTSYLVCQGNGTILISHLLSQVHGTEIVSSSFLSKVNGTNIHLMNTSQYVST